MNVMPKHPASVPDADTAWAHVLDHSLGLPDGNPDAETILRRSMEPRAGERFAALLEPLADTVRQRFAESAGGLGTLLAQGITAGYAGELLPIGLAWKPAETEAPAGVQADLFVEAGSPRAEAVPGRTEVAARSASRWNLLIESGMYAAQRQFAGRDALDDNMVRAALDALFESHGRLPFPTFARWLGIAPLRMRGVVADSQRLLDRRPPTRNGCGRWRRRRGCLARGRPRACRVPRARRPCSRGSRDFHRRRPA